MTLTLEITPETKAWLDEEAKDCGIATDRLLLSLVEQLKSDSNRPAVPLQEAGERLLFPEDEAA